MCRACKCALRTRVMDAKIINVYNDWISLDKGLKSGWGASFHITIGDEKALFDVGCKGKTLIHNIHALGIDIDKINKIVLSHGHRDHTGGLVSFLEARTATTPIPVIAHPAALEPKSGKMLVFHISMGLPKLRKELDGKIEFQLAKNPVEVLPKLSTAGEIPIAERPEKPGIATRAFHKVNGRRVWDPVIDDLSLILQAKGGLVIVTGCCHAGLLNTCARATRLFDKKIKAIVGGTHMMEYSKEDVERVGDVLKNAYGTPELYLSHCTGEKAIEQLKARFGSDTVHDCFAGSQLTFEI
jgi:7,8-dihydropterin-6-yl-methyl-4-(beta-D-ribofuranosyl)aminobenzene 5'-phosphate synthase